VNDTLDFTQLQFGKFKLHFDASNLPNVFESIAKLVRVQLSMKNAVKFILDVEEGIPVDFVTDEQRLKQVLVNILRISIKFTPKGHIKLTVSVVETNGPRTIKLEFYDSGIGIKESMKDNLFKIFGKLDDPNNINKDGTGLGLYICNQIIT
jgi:signal transduction histidine kinase